MKGNTSSSTPLLTDTPSSRSYVHASAAAWNRFWFTPADPTVLGLIRICCGLLALYTVIAYSWDLQAFFGKNALLNLELRRLSIEESPLLLPPLEWGGGPSVAVPSTPEERKYHQAYKKKWGTEPPAPYPATQAEAEEIDRYRQKWGVDPRMVFHQGSPEWSIWMHVTDARWMWLIHSFFILVTFLFTIGLGTRITSVLAWFAAMCYVHRSPVTLFGVDTMMLILMLYLMIGPSGAALSVDRWLAGWWRRRRAGAGEEGSAPDDNKEELRIRGEGLGPPRPTVSANVALRMLQIHVCIIYAAAGLAKLQGAAWWNGTAIWGTLANAEFAPMYSDLYMTALRGLAGNLLLLQLFLSFGTYFTLFFEISYPFLIWGKWTRWLMLGMALILHGVIGMIMGLKTFALMMLVMNMAFLPTETVHWFVRWLKGLLPSGEDAEASVAAGSTDKAITSPAGATTQRAGVSDESIQA